MRCPGRGAGRFTVLGAVGSGARPAFRTRLERRSDCGEDQTQPRGVQEKPATIDSEPWSGQPLIARIGEKVG